MPKKQVYYVEVPFTGKVGLYIAAEDKEDAIERAFNVVDINDKNQNAEWDFHRRVVQGNCFHGALAEAFAAVDTSMDLNGVDNPDDVTDEDLADDEDEAREAAYEDELRHAAEAEAEESEGVESE